VADGRHWSEGWARRTKPQLILCNSRCTERAWTRLYPRNASKARPHRARLWHAPDAPAAGIAAGRDRHDRGGQSLPRGAICARLPIAALPCPPPSRARPSSPMPARRSKRCCASNRSARSAVTTACAGTASSCRSHRSRTATTTSRRRCACTNTRTDGLPSLMDLVAWAASIAMASRSMPHGPLRSRWQADQCRMGRLTPLGGPACGFVANAPHCPQPHRPIIISKQRTNDVLRKADIFHALPTEVV
jgi:hypothetical protein